MPIPDDETQMTLMASLAAVRGAPRNTLEWSVPCSQCLGKAVCISIYDGLQEWLSVQPVNRKPKPS